MNRIQHICFAYLVAVVYHMRELLLSQEAQCQVELGHQQKLLDFPLLFLSDATLHLQPGDDALVLDDSLLKQPRLATERGDNYHI